MKEKEQRDEEGGGSDEEEEEDEGARDSLIAQKLIKVQQEESGRIRRAIASSVKLGGDGGFGVLVKHRHSVTAVTLSEDDSKGFSASKDGSIVQWDVDNGKCERYKWPNDSVLKSHGLKDPQSSASRQVRMVAIWQPEVLIHPYQESF